MNHVTPVPSTTPAAPVPLSITVLTLPPGDILRVYKMPIADDHVHHLVVLPSGVTLNRAAEAVRHLSGATRAHAFAALGVPDPDTSPKEYTTARWWTPGQLLDLDLIESMERAGRLAAWPHHNGAQAVTR